MPIYKVELERHVSRMVELRQTTSVFIEAPDLMTANDAAWEISRDDEEIDRFAPDQWEDDDSSRQASNDEVDRKPRVDRVYPVKIAERRFRISAPVANAINILGLDPSEHTQGQE